MYLYPNPCAYGSADITVTGNTVRNNLSSFQNDARPGLGGGVYVNAAAPGGACAGNVTVTLQNNTITGNNSDASGAGVFAFTNTAQGQSASITITQNTVDNNAAGSLETYSNGDYVLGFGGGVYVSTYGYGLETIDVNTNQVRGNSSEFDFGGGISGSVQATIPSNQTVRVRNNTVTGNTADVAGGGIEAFMSVFDLPATDTARVLVESNTVSGNTASLGGAGVIARASSSRSDSGNAEIRVQGNRISGNTSEFFGGGVEVNVSADSDPDDGFGPILPASMKVTLENNRIDSNTVSTGQTPPDGTAGGVFVFLNSRGDSTVTANLRLNTLWNNTIDNAAGVGGIALENETTLDTANNEGLAQVSIDSSILGQSNGIGVGGPAGGEVGVFATGLGTFNFDVGIDYSDFFGFTAGNFDTWIVPGVGNILNDPVLNATTLVPSACSATIDAGNPALPFALEPAPNGGRVNMGHTGNTAQATPSLADANGDGIVDGIDVVRLSVAFGSSTGQPRFNATTDFDSSGQVDGTDLAFLAGDFGETCP
jgi:dockerin type I repeat protein